MAYDGTTEVQLDIGKVMEQIAANCPNLLKFYAELKRECKEPNKRELDKHIDFEERYCDR